MSTTPARTTRRSARAAAAAAEVSDSPAAPFEKDAPTSPVGSHPIRDEPGSAGKPAGRGKNGAKESDAAKSSGGFPVYLLLAVLAVAGGVLYTQYAQVQVGSLTSAPADQLQQKPAPQPPLPQVTFTRAEEEVFEKVGCEAGGGCVGAGMGKLGARAPGACALHACKGHCILAWRSETWAPALPTLHARPADTPCRQACEEHYNSPPSAALSPGEEAAEGEEAAGAADATADRALLEAGGDARPVDEIASAVVEGTEGEMAEGEGQREPLDPYRDTGARAADAFDPEVHAGYLALPPWPAASEEELTVSGRGGGGWGVSRCGGGAGGMGGGGVQHLACLLAGPCVAHCADQQLPDRRHSCAAASCMHAVGTCRRKCFHLPVAPNRTLACPCRAPGLLEADRGGLQLCRQPPHGASAEPREAARGGCPLALPRRLVMLQCTFHVALLGRAVAARPVAGRPVLPAAAVAEPCCWRM